MRCDGSNPEKDAWITELREQGLVPIVQQLEQPLSKNEALEREVIWIRTLINQGIPLLNRGGVVEERATIELSLYFSPSQNKMLEDLRRAYKRHTKKKISANEVMRRLIVRCADQCGQIWRLILHRSRSEEGLRVYYLFLS
jgi:hypothetical protein